MTTAPTSRNVDRFDAVRTSPHRATGAHEHLRLAERVTALRERLEARADARSAARLQSDVREARGFVRGFDSRDVSDRTSERYGHVVAQMRAAGQRPEAAVSKNTFEYRRAALVHVTRMEVKGALRELDRAKRTKDMDRAAEAYNRIRTGLETLRRYPPTTGNREADLMRRSVYSRPTDADPDRSNGKRASLPGLPDDWRDAVQREAPERDRAAFAVISLTGARPAEVRGTKVRQAGDSVTLTIRGAKVDESRGVDVRTLAFSRDELAGTQAGRDLTDWLGARGQRTVAHEGSVEAFRERVSRAADRAGLPQVSAYTYRHAFARDLKNDGVSREEIAERMGHRSDRSQSVYG
ncbi:site-specific integrase [Paraburkholderia sediminicola]|uniref:tyrosine-type recombinase/integrase n=1 Tax=Paraburkholderia sediminicola TaxID=458836 RepID=UPI0038BD8B2B